MKKILFIAALTMVSATASASIARRNALDAVNGSAFPLVTANGTAITQSGVNLVTAITAADDVQDSFVNPGKMHSFGDLFTAEYQTGGTTAEGGVFRSMGDSKFGVYLNHKSALMSAMTSVTPGTPIAEQNPFEVFYGMKGGSLKWGASLLYSETKNNQTTTATAGTKTTDAGARFGIVADMWEAYVGLGLLGRAEKYNGDKSVADLAYRLGGQFNLPTVTLYADMQSGSGKSTVGTTDTKLSAQLITLGAESKVKSETAHFFYGARYITFNQKLGDNGSAATSRLPLYAGVEADAASWLTLRASLSQSVLIGTNKVNDAVTNVSTRDESGMADTTAALGAGLKWGKATVDGSLRAGTNGNFGLGDSGSTGFMTQVSLNYNF